MSRSIQQVINYTKISNTFGKQLRQQIVERASILPSKISKHFRRPTSALFSRFNNQF